MEIPSKSLEGLDPTIYGESLRSPAVTPEMHEPGYVYPKKDSDQKPKPEVKLVVKSPTTLLQTRGLTAVE